MLLFSTTSCRMHWSWSSFIVRSAQHGEVFFLLFLLLKGNSELAPQRTCSAQLAQFRGKIISYNKELFVYVCMNINLRNGKSYKTKLTETNDISRTQSMCGEMDFYFILEGALLFYTSTTGRSMYFVQICGNRDTFEHNTRQTDGGCARSHSTVSRKQ